MPYCFHISKGSPTIHSAYSRQAKGCENTSTRNWGTLILLYPPRRDARMLACRREGGGSIVAKGQFVMNWTRRRSARKVTDGSRPPKSESARSRKALFSGIAGDLLRRVVPCL